MVGCTKSPIDNGGTSEELGRTKIELGVEKISTSVIASSSGASRAVGTVMENLTQFGNETIALYGVTEAFGDGSQSWLTADRSINTTTATITVDNSVGKIDYGTTPSYYPEGGYLSIYALYPSNTAYVAIDDQGTTVATPPTATITLGKKFDEQYDVLHGATERLTAAQSQMAKVTFTHALAQLKFKIYKESADISARVSRITISGVSKASMIDIRKAAFTFSTDPADVVDFVAYDNATEHEVTKITATDAEPIGVQLMLFPGAGSVGRVTITIDGQDYVSDIPASWVLNQGKKNTVTLRVNKFGVRFENEWSISTWSTGTGVDEGLENNGKMIRITTNLENATGSTKSAYTGAVVMPETMDVRVDGYTYKNITVTVDRATGILTSEEFNSGWLNDNPRFIEALTLYDAAKVVMFSGKTNNSTLTNGKKIYIDTEEKGSLKLDSSTGRILGMSMTFGGFGDGTPELPYQVSDPMHLKNMGNLLGSTGSKAFNGTSSGGGVFVQVNDIDLASSPFTPIGQAYAFVGQYDGNYKRIKNINISTNNHAGLFGWVNKSGNSPTVTIKNVIIESGSITNTSTGSKYTAGVVGSLAAGSIVENCSNRATISGRGNGVGGIVGSLAGVSQVLGCANFGAISSTAINLGGVVGTSASVGKVENCYNSGHVTFNGTAANLNVGGVVAMQLTASTTTSVTGCYNRGTVIYNVANPTACGAFLGHAGSGAGATNLRNNYFLTGSYAVGVGNDLSASKVVTSNTLGKTATELKALAPTLGVQWEADDLLNPINEGYPILKWQKNR